MIKNILGIALIVVGILLGLYVGLWVMFIGGIMGLASGFDLHTLTATLIGINVIKIFLAGFVGWMIAYVGITIGALLLNA